MKNFKKMFEWTCPVRDIKCCNDISLVKATNAINKRMETIQLEFSAKSEMSQSKAAGFHFSC